MIRHDSRVKRLWLEDCESSDNVATYFVTSFLRSMTRFNQIHNVSQSGAHCFKVTKFVMFAKIFQTEENNDIHKVKTNPQMTVQLRHHPLMEWFYSSHDFSDSIWLDSSSVMMMWLLHSKFKSSRFATSFRRASQLGSDFMIFRWLDLKHIYLQLTSLHKSNDVECSPSTNFFNMKSISPNPTHLQSSNL